MKLLLLSLGLGALNQVAPAPLKMGFIPTAGEPYDNPSFVISDRKKLEKLGYDIIDIDITNIDEDEFARQMQIIDALFIAGGNSFYLMQQIKTRNLTNKIREYVLSDKPLIGTSAGAVICGPSLSPITTLDNPATAPELEDHKGLEIVDFVPLPHYGKEKHLSQYEKIIRTHADKYELIPFRDDQAILIQDDSDKQSWRKRSTSSMMRYPKSSTI